MVLLDPHKTVFTLTSQYPLLIEALVQAGFEDVKNPAVRQTAGRVMTLAKGLALKKIPRESFDQALAAFGFQLSSPT